MIEVLGDAPDFHILPVGNAGNISAYWKGYREFHAIKKATKLPRMIGFQAAGSAPIYHGKVIENPETIATAIRIGNPASWQTADAAILFTAFMGGFTVSSFLGGILGDLFDKHFGPKGRVLLMQAKLEEAEKLYARAVRIADDAGMPDEIMDPLLRLQSKILRDMKKTAQADAIDKRVKAALIRKADREGRRVPPAPLPISKSSSPSASRSNQATPGPSWLSFFGRSSWRAKSS